MPVGELQQVSFSQGLNAQTTPDRLNDGEVATATNIDFSLEPGAAAVRRGSTLFGSVTGTSGITQIFRNYNLPTNLGSSPFYVAVAGAGIYRGNNSSWTQLSAGDPGDLVGFGTYRDYALIGAGSGTAGFKMLKDDGTNVSDWIKDAPVNAPVLNTLLYTARDLDAVFTSPTVYLDGTATASGNWSFETPPIGGLVGMVSTASADLSTIGTVNINDYGIDYTEINITIPKWVTRISKDYSIGDSSFSDYMHAEVNLFDGINDELVLMPTVSDLLARTDLVGTSGDNLTPEERAALAIEVSTSRSQSVSRLSHGDNQYNSWAIPRTQFQFVGRNISVTGADPWTNVQAMRLNFETNGPTEILATNFEIQGDEYHSIQDNVIGVTYWVTYAVIDADGIILDQSPPSPPLSGVRINGGLPIITHVGTSTSTISGLTHKILYRAGGYLPDAYAVSTATISATNTFTDTLSDIKALTANRRMPSGIRTTSEIPNYPIAICEYLSRVFIFTENKMLWSFPGQPGTFPEDSYSIIGATGDEVQAAHPMGNSILIVNRDSVYEFRGSILEGSQQDWVLQRTGSRHGSKAGRTAIKTPYGVPLLDYDGITFYQVGAGVDQDIPWLSQKIGDLWRGTGTNDPAVYKGNRIPPLNKSYIRESSASYVDNKLYLAYPSGSATDPDTVLVIDFNTQRVWVYDYPFNSYSLYWDFVDNKLLNGGAGRIEQLENGLTDLNSAGSAEGIVYKVRSRTWTSEKDARLENLSVEYLGAQGTALGIYDNTSTVTLGTLTNTVNDWIIPALNGSLCNNISFELNGTATTRTKINNIKFNALVEPSQVRYWRTEYDNNGHTGENLWDVHHASLDIVGTGTITGVGFIDGVAVNTFTNFVGPTNGRKTFHNAYSNETYGNIAFTTYTSASDAIRFKHWDTWYSARKEPPPINNYRSDWQSLDENICDGHNCDINPNGTTTAIVYVDNTALSTHLYTGTKRQSFVSALPNETYGRTIFVDYTGSGFKHYNTWWDLRPEPDRMTNFVVTRESKDEEWVRNVNWDMNCLGTTVLATIFLDGTAISTKTCTGSLRQSYVDSLPDESMGRTKWVVYNANGTGKFKHFNTWWDVTPEPDRISLWHVRQPYSSENYIKTWVAELNPLGTCIGTMQLEGTTIATNSFIGTRHHVYNVGVDHTAFGTLGTGTVLDIIYNAASGARMKHYNTQLEAEPKPFGKKTWMITYKKVGGASRLDLARSWSADIECSGTATLTSIWYIDGRAYSTDTLTFTGREWREWIPMPPDGRGYIFHQEIRSTSDFRVWRSTLDMLREGAKGVSRMSAQGEPK